MAILLISYKAELLNKDDIKPIEPTKEIKWLDLKEIDKWKNQVSPYTQFLIEKGDIR
jgi:hypothetical protein